MEDRIRYTVTVCTTEFYVSYMKKENVDYIPAACPDIIVSILKDDVIKKALESYCAYDGYWLRLYYIGFFKRWQMDYKSVDHIKEFLKVIFHPEIEIRRKRYNDYHIGDKLWLRRVY